MASVLQPCNLSSPHWLAVAVAGCLGLPLGCTDSKTADTTSPEGGPAPSLEACMMLPSVRAGAHFESEQRRFAIALDALDPATPSLGDNTWRLALLDADAEPVNDATLSFSLWMPEHAHGSLKTVLIEPLDEGQYRAEPLSFHMPGIWEVTVDISSSNTSDQLVFSTCVVP